jgi:hypothetical protein
VVAGEIRCGHMRAERAEKKRAKCLKCQGKMVVAGSRGEYTREDSNL